MVLISFLQYCLTFLGGPQELARYLIAKQQAEIAEREEVSETSEQLLPPPLLPRPPPQPTPPSPHRRRRHRHHHHNRHHDQTQDERLGNDTKKVRTHAHHPPGCWCLCPCCPIWEPLQGKFSRPWGLGAEFVRLAMLGTLQ